ncbi:MAG: hypothetical protein H6779_01545 [Candidatus Nomurabacteria bacterium]|nr:hypothetical protein [Candidatus Nomurabacteria bacterium]USN88112.1 MAG: hypothetical protein H6779_01545 [Candidatus Nomurabacteria bacterium]
MRKKIIQKINIIQTNIVRLFVFSVIIFTFFSQFNDINQVNAATITLSGTLYVDKGVTTDTSGKTVKVAVGTSTVSVHSATTGAGGTWSFTDIDDVNLSTTTPFTVWLGGETDKATTIVMGYKGSDITSVPLYHNYVVSHTASSTDILYSDDFSFYDSSDDTDILYTNSGASTQIVANLLINQGEFLAPTNTVIVSGDYENIDTFTNNSGTLEIQAYLSGYNGGVDADGSSSGITSIWIDSFAVSGNSLFVGHTASTDTCAQTAGSARGCELQIYDISSSTNITYVAGRDTAGDNTGGAGNDSVYALAISGDYMYVGKSGNATACSQTAGSADGCELMVYDISSTTNPIYVAGRDVDGSSTGTTALDIRSLAISGSSLYIGKGFDTTACSQTAGSAIGCELMVYDISSTTNPIYVAGQDVTGDSTGTGGENIDSIAIRGNYLYIGKTQDPTACSQTAGSAIGCELMVFDISSTTNPIYVAGRDVDGSSTGNKAEAVYDIQISGNYLYMSKSGDITACSQTAGSARGCELMVFDISSTTNPIYVAGRDVTGDDTGVGNINATSIYVDGDYLYLGKLQNATACSQTAGSADGCELMVFDISSTTNPIYVAGRDVNGGSTGTGLEDINNLIKVGDNIYIGKSADATACSQVAGSAIGCELMSFRVPANMSGSMVSGDDFSSLIITGQVTFQDISSTTNLTISTSSTLTAPSSLTVAGDMSNYGTFNHSSGTITLSGTSQSLVSSATTTFYTLSKEVTTADTLTFSSGGTYVIEDQLTLTGTDGNLLSLRSSSSTGEWYIDPRASTTVAYLDVQDSDNINITTINCGTGCIDSGNNTNWNTNVPVTLASVYSYNFYVGQASTTLDQITITKNSSSTNIVAANDIRITIATTTTDFYFSTGVTTPTFGGTASGKVFSTVSYEDGGATLLIDVTSDFVNGDTLTIDNIEVGSFSTVSTTSGKFALHVDGSATTTAITEDTKTIDISGSMTLGNHTLGQVSNQFSFQNKTDEALYAFSLDPSGEDVTVTDIVFTLRGVQGIDTDNVDTLRLYRDINNDQVMDGGDELLDNSGIMTVNGQLGAITFSTDFYATTSSDYLIIGNTSSIDRGDSMTISLPVTGITSVGTTSAVSPVIIGSVDEVQHIRNTAGSGGSSSRTGDTPPPGNGMETGGGSGGGGNVGQNVDDENITYSPNYFSPSNTGTPNNEWTNPENAYNSDGVYATASTSSLRQSYTGFNFSIPGSNTIQGIAVKLDISGTTATGTVDVSLSWDGGSSYTTGKATPTLSGTDIVYTVGGNTDTWGRTWSSTEFTPSTFLIRVTATPESNTINLDALEVRVFHQTGGGGGGGGGRV